MKFYVTIEGVPKLKRSVLNLKLYAIINVAEILKDYGYTYETIDEYGIFIVNDKILSLIQNHMKSKRIRGIIYSNEYLGKDTVDNLFDTMEPFEKIQDIMKCFEYKI